MDDQKYKELTYDGPPKKEWVVQKFPIKSGGVLRSAMQADLFVHQVQWSRLEGKIKS